MSSNQVRSWLSALLRGLLVIAITSGIGMSALGSSPRLEHSNQDEASDAGVSGTTSFRGSGSPRIVKRLVGIDHLAINASVPDDIVAEAPCVELPDIETPPLIRRSQDARGSASVRGPPVDFTI